MRSDTSDNIILPLNIMGLISIFMTWKCFYILLSERVPLQKIHMLNYELHIYAENQPEESKLL